MIKLESLRWGDYSRLSTRSAQYHHKDPYEGKRKAEESESERVM